jgi:serine/threonine-protein kinase
MEEVKKPDLSFGTLAVKLLYTTAGRVDECLEIQKKIKELGVVPKKLGEIMIDKGYLTDMQVRHIFRVQGVEGGINELPGYQIMGRIGQGAMGTVYKALQLSMGRAVAVKVLSLQLSNDDKFIKRFFKEARMSAWLNHPNIVQGIDVGDYKGLYYFVMEFVDGQPLEEMIKQYGFLDERWSLQMILQIAQALDHAHKYNLVHRDIKARNILIDQDGRAKLCDLGLAQIAVSESEGAGIQAIFSGTPAYVSPEQAQRRQDLDIRSDIYSLGVTLYYCLVGDVPFHGTSLEVIDKHIKEMPVPPRSRNQKISITSNSIIQKMMAKNRDERHQTPVELIRDLELVLSGRPLPQMPGHRGNIRASPHLAKATALARLRMRRFRR